MDMLDRMASRDADLVARMPFGHITIECKDDQRDVISRQQRHHHQATANLSLAVDITVPTMVIRRSFRMSGSQFPTLGSRPGGNFTPTQTPKTFDHADADTNAAVLSSTCRDKPTTPTNRQHGGSRLDRKIYITIWAFDLPAHPHVYTRTRTALA